MLNCSIPEAVEKIKNGGVIIYPTETFFAIGCRADNEKAIHRIFSIKQRPFEKALPLLAANNGQIEKICHIPSSLQKDFEKLSSFWPAPLTIVLPAKKILPGILLAGGEKIAIRITSHPVARTLAELSDFPLVSTSANISNRPPVTKIDELDKEIFFSLDCEKDGVLDLPPSPSGGNSSTIIEPKGNNRLLVLRAGAFSLATLIKNGFSVINKEEFL